MSQDKPVSADQRMPWVKIPDLENKLKESVINPIKTPVGDNQAQAEREQRAMDFRIANKSKYSSEIYHNVLDEGEDWQEIVVDELGLSVAFATQEVSQAVAAEREENVKAVCAYCRNSEPLTTNGELELCHYRLAENGKTKIILCRCLAAAIHSRTEKEETK